ncbi:MAG: hypothetical protein ACK4QW_16115 [Alphaproteobacteria bacterium]
MGSRPALIDEDVIRGLAQARRIHAATVIGQADGWSVLVRYGSEEGLVGTRRAKQVRVWRGLDTVAGYVRSELGLSRFDVDTGSHLPAVSGRPSSATADLDDWVRTDIEQALREADDPAAVWFGNETVMNEVAAIFAAARAARGDGA